MDIVQWITIDFISYTFMCAQVAASVALLCIVIPTVMIINASERRKNYLLDIIQDNYAYDCRMIINQWCRLYVKKYGMSPIGRDQHVILFNLQDQLWTRTSTCIRTMHKIHHSM